MRTLSIVEEFKTEAARAVFTKQQAVYATLQLLQAEMQDPANTAEETALLQKAIERADLRYIDTTSTQTDHMLDTLGVARFAAQDIVDGISALVFDVE